MSVRSTIYTASTATYTYTSGTFLTTQVYTLQPQTSPFVFPSTCKRSIYCRVTSSGTTCFEFDNIASKTSRYLEPDCYPKGYSEIWYHGPKYKDAISLAFPGDTCPSGWSPLCMQEVVSGSSRMTQTYCCPSGYHSCTTLNEARNCFSYLTTATELWMNQDLATSQTANSVPVKITHSPASSNPLTVYHAVFPLVGAQQVVTLPPSTTRDPSQTGTSPPGESGTNGGGGNGGGGSSGLSTGAIAGIAVGAVAAVALLIGIGVVFLLRRRKAASQHAHSPLPQGLPMCDSGAGGVTPSPSLGGPPGAAAYYEPGKYTHYGTPPPAPSPGTVGSYPVGSYDPYAPSPGTVGSYPVGSYDPYAPSPHNSYSHLHHQSGEYYVANTQELPGQSVHPVELESESVAFTVPAEMESDSLAAPSPSQTPAPHSAHPSVQTPVGGTWRS